MQVHRTQAIAENIKEESKILPTPFVSVLMTAYNREKYIAEAIESVLASDYANFELIIVDDCSTDATLEIIKGYQDTTNKIKVFRNLQNLGDYPNRNRAASYAAGDFIVYLDSDDLMRKQSLGICVAEMLKFPQSDIGMYWQYSEGEAFCMSKIDSIRHHFFKQQFLMIGPGGTIMKRTFFEALNGYPEKYGPANDMYFNLHAACYSDVVLLPFEINFYRKHINQESNNQFSYLYNNYLYQKDAFRELPLTLTLKEIRWLQNKNRRRFVVNLFNHFRTNKDFKMIRIAIKRTSFGVKDFIKAIIH